MVSRSESIKSPRTEIEISFSALKRLMLALLLSGLCYGDNEKTLPDPGLYNIAQLEKLAPDYDRLVSNDSFKKSLLLISQKVNTETDLTKLNGFMSRLKVFFDFTSQDDLDELVLILQNIKEPISWEELLDLVMAKSSLGFMAGHLLADPDRFPEAADKIALLADPAFQLIKKFGYDKRPPHFVKHLRRSEQSRMLIMTARSLLSLGQASLVSEADFESQFKKVLALRSNPEFLQQPLFAGKNVFVLTDSEVIPREKRLIAESDSLRFFTQASDNALRGQNPNSLKVFRLTGSNDSTDVASFMTEATRVPKLCLLFEVHGLPDKLIWSNQTNLKVNDIAKILIERTRNGLYDTPILILNSCNSQEFTRSLYEVLASYNQDSLHAGLFPVALPLIISASEFGQASFSDRSSIYHNQFLESLFRQSSSSGQPVTMQTVLSAERNLYFSYLTGVSVFVPDNAFGLAEATNQPNGWMQVADLSPEEKDFVTFLRLNRDPKLAHYFETSNPDRAQQLRGLFLDKA